MLVVDAEGTIVFTNAALQTIWGSQEPLVGRSVDELVPDAVRSRHADLRASYAVAPTQRPMGSGLRLALRRDDGREVPVEISLSPFRDGDETYVVATVRDVTDRQESERRLAAADQQVALLEERERIGRDLHDVVLQRLYGTGLSVQAIGVGVDDATRVRLDGVIDEIDRIISEVRTIVFTLGHSGPRGALGQELADVVAQASRVLGFTPTLRMDGPVDSVLGDELRVEMIASMREALGNVARHAAAARVDVTIVVSGDQVVMQVTDDGVGPPADVERSTVGNGLANLAARAGVFGGSCRLTRHADGGALLTWAVPY